jgi:hypothetical protein
MSGSSYSHSQSDTYGRGVGGGRTRGCRGTAFVTDSVSGTVSTIDVKTRTKDPLLSRISTRALDWSRFTGKGEIGNF